MLVKLLDQQHDDFKDCINAWRDIDLLSRGGHALYDNAERFLRQRPKELSEVYRSRRTGFTYQDIIGTGIGWYQSALFPEDPEILIRRDDKELQGEDADFYTGFLKNCDRRGTRFSRFSAEIFKTAALFRDAWILTDLPKMGIEFKSRADQKAAGALNPYVCLYNPQQVINWSEDDAGVLNWVIFSSTVIRRQFGSEPVMVDRWFYFDRKEFRVYEAVRQEFSQKAENASLVDQGAHALADVGRVPVRRISVPDVLWLGDRVYLQAKDHLNTDNAFSWGLLLANLPVLVIKGEYEEPPTISETSYLKGDENSTFEYLEPKGIAYEHSAARISSLREEIYRQMYLQAQGRSSKAQASSQSGYSKEMDMAPAKDALNSYGDVLREAMERIFADVQAARNPKDVLSFSVRGFDFADTDTEKDIAEAEGALGLEIPSDTYQKEVQKRIARRVLKDATPEVLQTIEREIDAAPTMEEQAQAEAQQLQQRMQQSIQNGFIRDSGGTPGGMAS